MPSDATRRRLREFPDGGVALAQPVAHPVTAINGAVAEVPDSGSGHEVTQQFDEIIKAEGVKLVKLPPKSPNLNAYCERVVQTLQHEALDHFVVFGEDHLNHIVSEFVRYYHEFRPHQALDNLTLSSSTQAEQSDLADADEVVRYEWLGGLLKHYERRAA
jgi:putative transposase